MTVAEFVEIVETMALELSYPGYEVRALPLALPAQLANCPAKIYAAVLQEGSTLAKLAALRWFWQRPGIARRYLPALLANLGDQDEWVRREAARTLGRLGTVDANVASRLCLLLVDEHATVKKAAAQALGKLKCGNEEEVVACLRNAAQDADIAVKWKVEKALRKLGNYQ